MLSCSFIFILYVIAHQAICVYVRIKAKLNNDRTPVVTTNPLSGLVNAQLGQGGGDMVKDLASQFLSSKTTVMEYDLKQLNSMNGSLLFNMAFMWFLHFKMEQTQPLLLQTLTGTLNLVYHPLFQVYVLGRNLERPFKNPATKALTGAEETESGDENETKTQDNAADNETDDVEDESSSEEVDQMSNDDEESDEEEADKDDEESVEDEEDDEKE
jgi:Phosphate transport (Pho88)